MPLPLLCFGYTGLTVKLGTSKPNPTSEAMHLISLWSQSGLIFFKLKLSTLYPLLPWITSLCSIFLLQDLKNLYPILLICYQFLFFFYLNIHLTWKLFKTMRRNVNLYFSTSLLRKPIYWIISFPHLLQLQKMKRN